MVIRGFVFALVLLTSSDGWCQVVAPLEPMRIPFFNRGPNPLESWRFPRATRQDIEAFNAAAREIIKNNQERLEAAAARNKEIGQELAEIGARRNGGQESAADIARAGELSREQIKNQEIIRDSKTNIERQESDLKSVANEYMSEGDGA